ncbi:L-glyceraldehyde 3-phosphate reductase [Algoriphagus aestuariicola]|jgi:L-glyceraldehyde 3-phosphate reductase|uniref:L-glyceraldehyde 3-phosphate reductase n=1 Tax=Algoriphagus aestuariicola TaxID=1852016 RepID=A0ABS3BTT6_9BACT|nr:L-glyceraldehyde 3-phosphate reductase [Algoriphagus aestuariicola]MBN7801104.1 L-glyceraldehyde 3-phosphate reductase [Algoriphagus aestuariicola]
MQINDHNPLPTYQAAPDRYGQMNYRYCGQSGLMLPEISLGLWHNFGHNADLTLGRKILRRAFDLGICHFDLANNYGPPYGSAEENFGRIYKKDFVAHRDELLISSKAGWDMWPGPYGNFGSRKYLIASCDQSLKRMGLDYVDIFYHHRPDPNTPLEETMGALDQLVRQGKALYVGISQYKPEDTEKAYQILKAMGTPLLIHQPRYSMLDRWVEKGLLDVLGSNGIGSIAFSPLEQGLLTDKYLKGIPADSRAAKDGRYLKAAQIAPEKLELIAKLNQIAQERNQTLAQMAISWLLKDPRITSVLIGVSKAEQLDDNVAAIKNTKFSIEEIALIKTILDA